MMESSERAGEADEALQILPLLEHYGREFAGRSDVNPGCRSEGMAFFSSSGWRNDEAASVFSMALRRDEARENNVEEWRGGARQEPAHAPPSPTCRPLVGSATSTVFSKELKAETAFFSKESTVLMEFDVGLMTLKADNTGTPPREPSFPLPFCSHPPASCR